MSQMNMIEAIRSALDVMMDKDPTVVMMGEDIGHFGGVFRCTDGLQRKYGDHRVIDAPIAEGGIIGAAIGMGLNGLRPVPEIQFDIPASIRWPIQGAQMNPGLGWRRFLGRESPFPILKTGHAQLVGRTKCSLGHPARRLRLKQLLPFLAATPLAPGNRLVHRLSLRVVEHAAQVTGSSGWTEERCGLTGYAGTGSLGCRLANLPGV